MIDRVRVLVLMVFVILLLIVATRICNGANLLPEGDFENDGWIYLQSEPGWNPPELHGWQIWPVGLVTPLVGGANLGNRVACCDPVDGRLGAGEYSWMYSTTEIPAGTHWVELDAAAWGMMPCKLAVILGGQMFEWAVEPGRGWQHVAGYVVETKSAGVVWIGANTVGDDRVFVDNVAVHAPEPAGWMALAAGLSILLRRKY